MKSRFRQRIRWVPLAVAVAAACAETRAAPTFTVTDSAGVAIAVSEGGAWAEGEGWTLSPEPVAVYGGSDTEDALWRSWDYARAEDGTVAVLSVGHVRIQVFDGDGAFLRSIGREGQGPGELTAPSSIAIVPPDTLLVIDRDAIATFLLDGTFLGSDPVGMIPNAFGEATAAMPYVVAPDRSILARAMRRNELRTGVYRPWEGWAAMAPSGELTLLGWFGGIEQERIDVGEGRTRAIVSPFARSSMFAVAPSGPARYLVADNEHYDMQIFDGEGSLLRRVRRIADPVAVRPEWLEEWKDAQRGASWTAGQLPDLERGWAAMTVRETLPAFDGVSIDSEGYLWVLRAEGQPSPNRVFDVFDPEGRYLGEVTVPAGLRGPPIPPVRAGDGYFMGLWVDDLEVETLRLYELRGR